MNADAAVVTVTLEVGKASPIPAGPLPRTGADLDVLVALGLALILVGIVTLLLARIRLETTHG